MSGHDDRRSGAALVTSCLVLGPTSSGLTLQASYVAAVGGGNTQSLGAGFQVGPSTPVGVSVTYGIRIDLTPFITPILELLNTPDPCSQVNCETLLKQLAP
jgi:hypothetical protein